MEQLLNQKGDSDSRKEKPSSLDQELKDTRFFLHYPDNEFEDPHNEPDFFILGEEFNNYMGNMAKSKDIVDENIVSHYNDDSFLDKSNTDIDFN